MKEETKKKKSLYDLDYKKKNIKRINLDLNYNTDLDIIDYFESIENKNAYLKALIRKDMKKNKKF